MKNRAISLTLLPFIGLGACTTTEELSQRPVAYQATGDRPVPDTAACVTQVLKMNKGALVTNDTIPGGVRVSLNVHGQFGNIVFTMIDIVREADLTKLTVKGLGHRSKNPEKDYAPYAQCVKTS